MKKGHSVLIIIILILQIYTIHKIPTQLTITERIIYKNNITYLSCQVTAYTNRVKECNSDNKRTAILEKPIAGWTCAVSQDLIHWLGGRVYIKGIGVRRVNDLMNARYSKSVDIYMGKVKDAKTFGKQTRMIVYLGK